jgi:hypothetical protein
VKNACNIMDQDRYVSEIDIVNKTVLYICAMHSVFIICVSLTLSVLTMFCIHPFLQSPKTLADSLAASVVSTSCRQIFGLASEET